VLEKILAFVRCERPVMTAIAGINLNRIRRSSLFFTACDTSKLFADRAEGGEVVFIRIHGAMLAKTAVLVEYSEMKGCRQTFEV
jgi:hypothetical protein